MSRITSWISIMSSVISTTPGIILSWFSSFSFHRDSRCESTVNHPVKFSLVFLLKLLTFKCEVMNARDSSDVYWFFSLHPLKLVIAVQPNRAITLFILLECEMQAKYLLSIDPLLLL